MLTLSCICLPDEKSSEKISSLMQEVSKEAESKNALAFPPHFSIRNDFKIEEKKVPKLIKDLTSLCKTTNNFNLHLTQYGFYPWRIIYLEIKKTDQLQKFHNKCMQIVENYRTNWIPVILQNNPHFKGKQKEYIYKYGYQFAFEFYSPHFTLAGNDIKEEVFAKLKNKLKNRKENILITVKSLALINRQKENQIVEEFPINKGD